MSKNIIRYELDEVLKAGGQSDGFVNYRQMFLAAFSVNGEHGESQLSSHYCPEQPDISFIFRHGELFRRFTTVEVEGQEAFLRGISRLLREEVTYLEVALPFLASKASGRILSAEMLPKEKRIQLTFI